MPNFAPITINNGTENMVMKPSRMDGTQGVFTSVVPDTSYFHQMVVNAPGYTRNNLQSPKLRLTIPILRGTGVDMKYAGVLTANVTIDAPRGADAERTVAIECIKSALTNQAVLDVLVNGEGLW